MKNVNFSAQDRTVFKFAHSETQEFCADKGALQSCSKKLKFSEKKKKKA